MIPTRVGQRVPGGYFAGINRISNRVCAVVVSPKCTEIILPWNTSYYIARTSSTSNDGLENTRAKDSADHRAAQYCLGLEVDGCNDFYLPAMCELELIYRNLKPVTRENFNRVFGTLGKPVHLATGTNLHSVPLGNAYTKTNPSKTVVTSFSVENNEAMDPSWYWSSTVYMSYSTDAVRQFFADGDQHYDYCAYKYRVRAVRRIYIQL